MLSPHPPQIHSSEKNTSRFWLLREIHLWDQIFIKFWDHSASLDCCIDIDIFMRFWSDDIIIRFPSNSYFWDHPASLHCCSRNLQVDHLGSHDSRWFLSLLLFIIYNLLFNIIIPFNVMIKLVIISLSWLSYQVFIKKNWRNLWTTPALATAWAKAASRDAEHHSVLSSAPWSTSTIEIMIIIPIMIMINSRMERTGPKTVVSSTVEQFQRRWRNWNWHSPALSSLSWWWSKVIMMIIWMIMKVYDDCDTALWKLYATCWLWWW